MALVSGTGTGKGGAVSLVAGTSQAADGAPMVILGSKALVRATSVPRLHPSGSPLRRARVSVRDSLVAHLHPFLRPLAPS